MSESNHSGQFLESIVERELSSRGFLPITYGIDADNLHLFEPKRLVRNAPYTSLYDCDARSEFLGVDQETGRRFRIECRFQGVSGSVDEKFPYLLRNAVECMPENEIIILLGGEGARAQAIRWFKTEASKIVHKRISVMSINEFMQWVKQFPIVKQRKQV